MYASLYNVVNTAVYGFSNVDSETIDVYDSGIALSQIMMFSVNLVLLNLLIAIMNVRHVVLYYYRY